MSLEDLPAVRASFGQKPSVPLRLEHVGVDCGVVVDGCAGDVLDSENVSQI